MGVHSGPTPLDVEVVEPQTRTTSRGFRSMRCVTRCGRVADPGDVLFGNVPGGLGAEKVRGEAVLRAENLHADQATVFEVEDDFWKVVLVIERNRDREPPT